jgi:hypothetical protein
MAVAEGRVLVPEETIGVEELVSKHISSAEDKEQIEWGGVVELIGARWSIHPILSFEWDGFGPITWHLGLSAFEMGDGRMYVCIMGEEECGGIKVVAALEPPCDAVFRAFFLDLVSQNGESYGYRIFGSLPTMTQNSRPELLSTSIVREAYKSWMNWSQIHGGQTWADLLTYLRHVITEPDHLKRVMAWLEETNSDRRPSDHPQQVRQWEAARERARNASYFEWERDAILELYFRHSYGTKAQSPHGVMK